MSVTTGGKQRTRTANPRAPLSRGAWRLLLVSGLFALSVGLSNTFVNIYLWKVDRSYTAIGWYNLTVYACMPLAFALAGALAKRRQPVLTLRLGIALHGLFYALVLAGGRPLAHFPAVPGFVMGVAAGFYWLSFNWLSLLVTEQAERDRFYGHNGVFGAIAGMLAPTAAGWLITHEDRLGGLTGYHVIFGLSLALFAAAAAASMRLSTRPVGDRLRPFAAWFAAANHAQWRMTLFGCGVYGLREGVFLFLIGLLLYVATGSELELGEFLLLQNGLSFASFWVTGRYTRESNRLVVIGMGAVGMAATALIFTLPLRAWLIVCYGALIAVFLPLFLVPLQGTVFNQIARLDESGKTFVEHIIAREVLENAGRVLGIAAFLAVIAAHPDARAIGWFATALGYVQLGSWGLLWRGSRLRSKSDRLRNQQIE